MDNKISMPVVTREWLLSNVEKDMGPSSQMRCRLEKFADQVIGKTPLEIAEIEPSHNLEWNDTFTSLHAIDILYVVEKIIPEPWVRSIACDFAEHALSREEAAGRPVHKLSLAAIFAARAYTKGDISDEELEFARKSGISVWKKDWPEDADEIFGGGDLYNGDNPKTPNLLAARAASACAILDPHKALDEAMLNDKKASCWSATIWRNGARFSSGMGAWRKCEIKQIKRIAQAFTHGIDYVDKEAVEKEKEEMKREHKRGLLHGQHNWYTQQSTHFIDARICGMCPKFKLDQSKCLVYQRLVKWNENWCSQCLETRPSSGIPTQTHPQLQPILDDANRRKTKEKQNWRENRARYLVMHLVENEMIEYPEHLFKDGVE